MPRPSIPDAQHPLPAPTQELYEGARQWFRLARLQEWMPQDASDVERAVWVFGLYVLQVCVEVDTFLYLRQDHVQ